MVGAGGAGAGAGGGSGLTLRLRSRAGLWRVEGLSPSSTIAEVKARLRDEKGIDVAGQVLSFRSKGDALPDGSTLAALGAEHGTMLFLEFTGDVAPATAERMVDKDGRIVPVSHEEARKTSGFRPGMAAMRDLQKQWTWTDFMDLQRSLEFDVKKQKAPRCSRVTLDTEVGLQERRGACLLGEGAARGYEGERKENKETEQGKGLTPRPLHPLERRRRRRTSSRTCRTLRSSSATSATSTVSSPRTST